MREKGLKKGSLLTLFLSLCAPVSAVILLFSWNFLGIVK